MADKQIDFNALGQVIDTTWGRSSTPKTSSYSVKVSILNQNQLLVSFQTVVNFGTERQMIEMKRAYVTESRSVVEEAVKQIKAKYKELSGNSITVKEENTQDSLEIIGLAVHNPKKTALYRRKSVFSIK